MNPPYMEDGDPNYNGSGMGFSDKSIRAGFIRRVYSILSVSKLRSKEIHVKAQTNKQFLTLDTWTCKIIKFLLMCLFRFNCWLH